MSTTKKVLLGVIAAIVIGGIIAGIVVAVVLTRTKGKRREKLTDDDH